MAPRGGSKGPPLYLELVGQAKGFQDVDIRARVEGYLEKVSFNEGTFVRQGDLLYEIDRKPLEATLAEASAPAGDRRGQAGQGQQRRRPLHAARRQAGGQPAGTGQRGGRAGRRAVAGRGRQGRRREGDARSRLHPHRGSDRRAHRHHAREGRQPGRPRREHAADDDLADRSRSSSASASPRPTTCGSPGAPRLTPAGQAARASS